MGEANPCMLMIVPNAIHGYSWTTLLFLHLESGVMGPLMLSSQSSYHPIIFQNMAQNHQATILVAFWLGVVNKC